MALIILLPWMQLSLNYITVEHPLILCVCIFKSNHLQFIFKSWTNVSSHSKKKVLPFTRTDQLRRNNNNAVRKHDKQNWQSRKNSIGLKPATLHFLVSWWFMLEDDLVTDWCWCSCDCWSVLIMIRQSTLEELARFMSSSCKNSFECHS